MRVVSALYLVTICLCFPVLSQSPSNGGKHFEKDGLVFDYAPNWSLSDQSSDSAQQLVLTEKELDAQIMVIALRATINSAKQEEEAKAALIEPSISSLLRQYDRAGIKVERGEIKTKVAGNQAEGAQLRFSVDGQLGTTDIYWLLLNRRLVQLFFIRPDKSAAKAIPCWEMIRNGLRIQDSKAKRGS